MLPATCLPFDGPGRRLPARGRRHDPVAASQGPHEPRRTPTLGVALCGFACALLAAACGSAGDSGGGNGSAPTMTVVVIDVGQGDAMLIIGPGTADSTSPPRSVLIDSGLGQDGFRDPEGKAVASVRAALDRHLPPGDTLDVFIATHCDADHVGGVGALVANGFTDDATWFVQGTADQTHCDDTAPYTAGGVRMAPRDAGEILLGQGARLRVVAAEGRVRAGGPVLGDGDNEDSIAVLLSFGAFDLFTGGDLSGAPLTQLVAERDAELRADVAKLNHHGAGADANPPEFLEAVSPQIVLISVGDSASCGPGFNQYGHPTQVALDAIGATATVQHIYQTETGGEKSGGSDCQPQTPRQYPAGVGLSVADGNIVLTTDGETFSIALPDGTGRSYSAE